MSSPLRRPTKRLDLGVVRAAKEFATAAPAIEAGWSQLRAELRDAGWPSRTPEDDLRARTPHDPSTTPDDELSGTTIDYSDPTGDAAMSQLPRMQNDLNDMQTHRLSVENATRAMHRIARNYLPSDVATIPACTITSCGDPVESRQKADGGYSFVGMEKTDLGWVAKPGVDPKCSRHRKQAERKGAA